MSTKVLALVCILGVLCGFGVPNAHSQVPDSTLDAQVKQAVHGPDGAGRDGPMATLDRGLISLYYEHQAYLEGTQSGAFSPSDDQLPVRDAHVTIDAIAKKRPEGLLDSLRALGLQNGAQAERLVSGRLPIEALRDAAGLSLLQSMRAAQAQTRTNTGGMLPPPPPDANVSETAPDTVSSNQGASQAEAPEAESTPTAESDQPPAPNAPEDGETESDPRSSGTEPVEKTKADSNAAPDADTDQSTQTDSASPPGPTDGNTDTSDTLSASASDNTSSPTWVYVVGGIVILGLGVLFGLRRRG
jgi:MYXO-CTERM domain-containing protein